jgi:hypothetical protein
MAAGGLWWALSGYAWWAVVGGSAAAAGVLFPARAGARPGT